MEKNINTNTNVRVQSVVFPEKERDINRWFSNFTPYGQNINTDD